MNKKIKKILMFVVFGFLFFATGCSTSSFCTAKDKENIRQAYAEKITIVVVDYYENEYHPEGKIPLTSDYSVVIDEAFVTLLDDEEILSNSNLNKKFDEEGFNDLFKLVHNEVAKLNNLKENEVPNIDVNAEKYVLTYTKLVEEQQFLYKNEKGKWKNPKTLYSNVQNNLWKANPQACLTNKDFEDVSGATIEGKTWGDAWGEGLLEGLFVYPISWLLYTFTNLIGDSGVGQVISIFVTTVLVRLLTIAFSLKSTIQSQRMQLLQPELQRIQAKYASRPNDPIAKQKMTQEMMKLYSKYKINPLTTLITPFLSMPIFFAMWGAVNRTAIIRTGSLFGLNMSTTLNTGIFSGNIFAIILFVIMIVGQYASMKLPQWIQKAKAAKKVRLEDPRTKNAPNQMKWMTNMFLFMIIFMGFMLPAAMTVYWIAGSLFSIAQTLLINSYTERQKAKAGIR